MSTQKQLISQLNDTLAEKVITISERGLTSVDWTVYNNSTKRTRYSSVPSSDVATRPLAFRKDGTWYAYGWDLTQNICEVYGQHGYIRTAYTYSPYGQIEINGDVTQPIQWSSEFNDTDAGLVYYHFRYYNPIDGRWIGRDRIAEWGGLNLYLYVANNAIVFFDSLGLDYTVVTDEKKCTITFKLVIVLSFDETVPNSHQSILAERIEKTIESEWSGYKKGCCSVSVDVEIRTSMFWNKLEDLFTPVGRENNYMTVTYNQSAGYNKSQRSYTTGTGNIKNGGKYVNTANAAEKAQVNPRTDYDVWAWAHETGHLVGLEDGYDPVTNKIKPGYNGDEMMTSDRQSVKKDDIRRLTSGLSCPCSPQNNNISTQ